MTYDPSSGFLGTDANRATRQTTGLVTVLGLLALALLAACGGGAPAGLGNTDSGPPPPPPPPSPRQIPPGVPILFAVRSTQGPILDSSTQIVERFILDGQPDAIQVLSFNDSFTFARSSIRPWTTGTRVFVVRQAGVGLAPNEDVRYAEFNPCTAQETGLQVVIEGPVRPSCQALLGDTLHCDALGAVRRVPSFSTQSVTSGEELLPSGTVHFCRGNAGTSATQLYDAEVTDSLITFYRRSPTTGVLTPVGSFVRNSTDFDMFRFQTVAWEDGCAYFARASLVTGRLEIWKFCDTFPSVTPAERILETLPIIGLQTVLSVDVCRGNIAVLTRRQFVQSGPFDDGGVVVHDTTADLHSLIELNPATYHVQIHVEP